MDPSPNRERERERERVRDRQREREREIKRDKDRDLCRTSFRVVGSGEVAMLLLVPECPTNSGNSGAMAACVYSKLGIKAI